MCACKCAHMHSALQSPNHLSSCNKPVSGHKKRTCNNDNNHISKNKNHTLLHCSPLFACCSGDKLAVDTSNVFFFIIIIRICVCLCVCVACKLRHRPSPPTSCDVLISWGTFIHLLAPTVWRQVRFIFLQCKKSTTTTTTKMQHSLQQPQVHLRKPEHSLVILSAYAFGKA